MNRDEAASFLGVAATAGAAEVQRAAEGLESALSMKLREAPSPALAANYQRDLAKVSEATRALGGSSTGSAREKDLPAAQPTGTPTAARGVAAADPSRAATAPEPAQRGPSDGGAAPRTAAPTPAAPQGKDAGKERASTADQPPAKSGGGIGRKAAVGAAAALGALGLAGAVHGGPADAPPAADADHGIGHDAGAGSTGDDTSLADAGTTSDDDFTSRLVDLIDVASDGVRDGVGIEQIEDGLEHAVRLDETQTPSLGSWILGPDGDTTGDDGAGASEPAHGEGADDSFFALDGGNEASSEPAADAALDTTDASGTADTESGWFIASEAEAHPPAADSADTFGGFIQGPDDTTDDSSDAFRI